MRNFIYACMVFFSFPAFSQEPGAIDSLKKLISKAAPDTLKVKALDDLCWEYLYYDPEKAIPFADEGIGLAREIGFKKGEGTLLNTLGSVYNNLRNFPKALANYEAALKIKEETGDSLGVAKCLVNIGNVHLLKGDYSDAIAWHMKGLIILERLGEQQYVASTYNNIASGYEHQENYAQAFHYASQGLKISEDLGYDFGIMDARILIGNFHKVQKDFQNSLKCYQEALAVAIRNNDVFTQSICYHNSADVYKSLSRTKEALENYHKQLEIAEEINSTNDLMYANMGIGETYLLIKNYDASKTHLSRALSLSKQLHTRDETKQIYGDLSRLYEQKKEFGQALAFHKLFLDLKDSLFNEVKSRQVSELNIRYETEKKENEIKLLNQNNLLQASALSNERLLRNFSVIGFAMILLIAVLLFIMNRQRNRANKLLTWQKQELQAANAIKTRLFSAISHDLRSPLTSLHGLLQIIEEKDSREGLKPLIDHANSMMSNTINLLDNLLYWSASQVKGIPMKFDRVDVSEIAEENKDLFSSLAAAKQIKFTNELKKGETVYADASSVRLVFRNLISNAIKFTPSGGTITMSAGQGEHETIISIADTGMGIDQAALTKLFTPEQSSTRGTSNEKGTGLGLLLCREFIEKNGGKIWAERGEGNGTVFRFTLKTYKFSDGPPLDRLTSFLSTTEA